MSKSKRYTLEFKLEAAKLVVEQGYSMRQAAERLGTTPWSLRCWIKEFQSTGQLPPKGQAVNTAEELKTLRKEVKQFRLENEILKKATAYFAKDQL